MRFTLDYFVAELQCPYCKQISLADNSTNMVTYIRDEPELAYLGIGHPLKIEIEAISEKGYLTIRKFQSDEPIKIIQPWECPSCGRINWAEICVNNRKIERITTVTLNRETLENAHFIHFEAKGVAAALTERTFADLSDEEVVPILKNFLMR